MSIPMYDMGVTFTQLSTGVSATVTNECCARARVNQLARRLFRSKVYAHQHGLRPSAKEVAVYDLPEGVQWPNDLLEYRTPGITDG